MNIAPNRLIGCLCLVIGMTGLQAIAEAQEPASRAEDFNMHFDVNLGLNNWSSLSDLRPASGGSFRRSGFGIGGGVHWRIGDRERRRILAGFDAYVFSDDSNVHHIYNDVTVNGLLLTPSVRFQFDNSTGPRYMIGAGVGHYEADITEVTSLWWGETREETLWHESSHGMWIGLDVEFPRKDFRRDRGFFVSARIHEFDFGVVRDESALLSGRPTLGQNAGTLTGPLIAVHFGHHWLH